jgi:hypothetical protein
VWPTLETMPFDCTNWKPEEPGGEGSDRFSGSAPWIFLVALILVVVQICVLVPLALGPSARRSAHASVQRTYVACAGAGSCAAAPIARLR